MAIKNLLAEKQDTQYFFRYTLDDTKLLEDGSPDPAYIREYSYALNPPQGMSAANYQAMMKTELNLLNQEALAALNAPAVAPTPLAGF